MYLSIASARNAERAIRNAASKRRTRNARNHWEVLQKHVQHAQFWVQNAATLTKQFKTHSHLFQHAAKTQSTFQRNARMPALSLVFYKRLAHNWHPEGPLFRKGASRLAWQGMLIHCKSWTSSVATCVHITHTYSAHLWLLNYPTRRRFETQSKRIQNAIETQG